MLLVDFLGASREETKSEKAVELSSALSATNGLLSSSHRLYQGVGPCRLHMFYLGIGQDLFDNAFRLFFASEFNENKLSRAEIVVSFMPELWQCLLYPA